MRLPVLLLLSHLLIATPTVASDDDGFGYASVAAARTALRENPDAKFREERGWTVVNVSEAGKTSIWSFAPPEHPAYPVAVKRTIFEQNGSIVMVTHAKCESDKASCDQLMDEFRELERQIKEQMRAGGDA